MPQKSFYQTQSQSVSHTYGVLFRIKIGEKRKNPQKLIQSQLTRAHVDQNVT